MHIYIYIYIEIYSRKTVYNIKRYLLMANKKNYWCKCQVLRTVGSSPGKFGLIEFDMGIETRQALCAVLQRKESRIQKKILNNPLIGLNLLKTMNFWNPYFEVFLHNLNILDLKFGFLWKTVYIAGWKHLETLNLVNKSANLLLKQFFCNLISGLANAQNRSNFICFLTPSFRSSSSRLTSLKSVKPVDCHVSQHVIEHVEADHAKFDVCVVFFC